MKDLGLGLVDMHCHILFGVDDGAKDLETSMEMIKLAYEDGIRTILLTPHYHPKRGMASVDEVYDAYETLSDQARHEFPDLALYLGREVYYTSDHAEKMEEHEELRICGGRNVLIEFSTGTPADYILRAVDNVIMMGFTPIVAHIERYACTLEHRDLVEDVKDKGTYIQINADSVLGENGFATQRLVKWLLKNELVDFIASDAHDARNRTPKLSKCYRYVAKKYGAEYADYCMHDMPLRILDEEI